MPEYLAPGVFVEETLVRPKNIEGVPTSITGFVGQCRYGPVIGLPVLVTSLNDFQNTFGGFEPLILNGVLTENYFCHSVKSFFDNGGRQLYVSRIFHPSQDTGDLFQDIDNDKARGIELLNGGARFKACFPGAIGNSFKLTISTMRSGNLLGQKSLSSLKTGDVVEATTDTPKNLSITESGQDALNVNHLYVARVHQYNQLLIELVDRHGNILTDLDHLQSIQKINQSLVINALGHHEHYESLSCYPDSDRFIGNNHLSMDTPGLEINAVFLEIDELPHTEAEKFSFTLDLFIELMSSSCSNQTLSQGNDGQICEPEDYSGRGCGGEASGLKALELIDDIAVVAAPGSSELSKLAHQKEIRNLLIKHCEQMKYRFTILSANQDADVRDVRKIRSEYDTSYAALYYPWLVIDSKMREGDSINIPPEGAIAGIYARNDIERWVHKAPANTVVRGIRKFNREVTQEMQEVLNPEGINCLRYITGHGYQVWGARTISAAPEWKYVNSRRLVIFLEHSIARGTDWAVFEPNDEALWKTISSSIEVFLTVVWRSGVLVGNTTDEAFFVRCDKSTMTQNDLDNGRLNCMVGVALIKPAEFVIFRIGQRTADDNI